MTVDDPQTQQEQDLIDWPVDDPIPFQLTGKDEA